MSNPSNMPNEPEDRKYPVLDENSTDVEKTEAFIKFSEDAVAWFVDRQGGSKGFQEYFLNFHLGAYKDGSLSDFYDEKWFGQCIKNNYGDRYVIDQEMYVGVTERIKAMAMDLTQMSVSLLASAIHEYYIVDKLHLPKESLYSTQEDEVQAHIEHVIQETLGNMLEHLVIRDSNSIKAMLDAHLSLLTTELPSIGNEA